MWNWASNMHISCLNLIAGKRQVLRSYVTLQHQLYRLSMKSL